ncbi:MAG TPA: hydroxylamine reductase [Bacillota bacterium]|nr:hydroxylamine reductase [Bacillota bacterium]HQD18343.1 hydroxylamine reductase [Bacillota bacterium]
MFCYQCEQRAREKACTSFGVCGKDPETAALQDLLIHACKGISWYAHRAYNLGKRDRDIDVFVVESLFTTVTNVNFDSNRLRGLIEKSTEIRKKARALYESSAAASGKATEQAPDVVEWSPAASIAELVAQRDQINERKVARLKEIGDDIVALEDLILFGLKGMAAYIDHAQILGVEDENVYAFVHEILSFLSEENHDIEELFQTALRVGEVNIRVMELLDQANTSAYGHPQPTKVKVTPVKGNAILVSGHDLKDLKMLLEQTEGTGINIYTHGEMLPAHGYPELKKHSHLVGNYGGAWQDQQREFSEFPGAILMTTNCIQKPRETYKGRIFTTGLVAWPGVTHIADKDFTPVIQAALEAPGFEEDGEERYITVGFARNAVLGVEDEVINAVKSGAIRHFFLIGGCDGAKSGRNYYTELAEKIPQDCVILTLACGKYRFNKLDFGDIDGIPRLLDVGQCNDAYSAVKIALALAEAFETDVNNLPLSIILSWYEQKAVAILLSLFYLGIKNMRIGPTLPSFITPSIYNVLKEKFNVMPITTADEDLKAILGDNAAETA